MTKTDKALQILRFAYRARKITLGMTATRAGLKKRKVKAVLLASDLSPHAKNKVASEAAGQGLPVLGIASKAQLGELFGRDEVGIVGILDAQFARAMREILS
ncbi:MAG: hypothetical protein D6743_10035 [Calditrichaeota bacterium]|nr:MAG: hypothetical protein D6743_10035 [Calditrichota bacterium]